MASSSSIHARPRRCTFQLALMAWCVMLASFASREPRPRAVAPQAALAVMPLFDSRETAQVLAVAELYRASTGVVPRAGWTLLASSGDWLALREVLTLPARRLPRLAGPVIDVAEPVVVPTVGPVRAGSR